MLRQRVLTALIMALLFLAILFFSSQPVFVAAVTLLLILSSWEWTRLADIQRRGIRILYVLATLLLSLGIGWFLFGLNNDHLMQTLLVVTCSWWAIVLLWVQGYPSSSVLWGYRWMLVLMGWILLIPSWISLWFIRHQNHGEWLILLVVAVVAFADIGAYFSGKRFGRRKLAPDVSPGKSWEGFFGGLLFSSSLAILVITLTGGQHWLAIVVVIVATALVSVLGDLFISMVKRHRGVKDTGTLLPGHGGVLDRIDGLMAAVPVFALMLMVTHWRL